MQRLLDLRDFPIDSPDSLKPGRLESIRGFVSQRPERVRHRRGYDGTRKDLKQGAEGCSSRGREQGRRVFPQCHSSSIDQHLEEHIAPFVSVLTKQIRQCRLIADPFIDGANPRPCIMRKLALQFRTKKGEEDEDGKELCLGR